MNSSLKALMFNLIGCKFDYIDDSYIAYNGSSQKLLSRDHIRIKLRSLTRGYTDSQFRLLLRKSDYPYEYMDLWDRFLETELPLSQMFYSSLSGSGLSNSNYEHAQEIWREFAWLLKHGRLSQSLSLYRYPTFVIHVLRISENYACPTMV